jgi:hypothetical protein
MRHAQPRMPEMEGPLAKAVRGWSVYLSKQYQGNYLNQFIPTVNCTVLTPGFGVVRPALDMCS